MPAAGASLGQPQPQRPLDGPLVRRLGNPHGVQSWASWEGTRHTSSPGSCRGEVGFLREPRKTPGLAWAQTGWRGARPPGLGAEGHCGVGTPGYVQSCTATRPRARDPSASSESRQDRCVPGDPRPLELEAASGTSFARGPLPTSREPDTHTARPHGPPPWPPPWACPTGAWGMQPLANAPPAWPGQPRAVRGNGEGDPRGLPARPPTVLSVPGATGLLAASENRALSPRAGGAGSAAQRPHSRFVNSRTCAPCGGQSGRTDCKGTPPGAREAWGPQPSPLMPGTPHAVEGPPYAVGCRLL